MSYVIRHDIDIDASKEAVRDVLADFPRYVEWSNFSHVEGTAQVGNRLSVKMRCFSFRPTVTVAQPGARLQWSGTHLSERLFLSRHSSSSAPTRTDQPPHQPRRVLRRPDDRIPALHEAGRRRRAHRLQRRPQSARGNRCHAAPADLTYARALDRALGWASGGRAKHLCQGRGAQKYCRSARDGPLREARKLAGCAIRPRHLLLGMSVRTTRDVEYADSGVIARPPRRLHGEVLEWFAHRPRATARVGVGSRVAGVRRRLRCRVRLLHRSSWQGNRRRSRARELGGLPLVRLTLLGRGGQAA